MAHRLLAWADSAEHQNLSRGDEVEIETWFQAEGRIGACRNWLIRDKASGQQLGQGTRCVRLGAADVQLQSNRT